MPIIIRQILQFLGFSGIGWILDFIVYTILSLFVLNLFICNVCSSFVGVSFVFIFSTRFVFQNKQRIPLLAKYFIYILYQVVLILLISKLLVFVNALIIDYLNFWIFPKFSAVLSKMLVTPITMTCNFIVLKYISEKL